MKRIYETGCSMVEMLGTLAIIGVLSIGDIMGYSYGMDKYRANETLNELQIRIIDLSQQMQNGAFDLSLGEMGNTTRMGYPISVRISPQFADYFEVFVDNVPSGVCHRLLESKWTVPYSIFVGIDEYEADEGICDACAKEVRYTAKLDATYCMLCGVAGTPVENKPLMVWGGTCHSCEDTQGLRVNSAANCLKTCPNRVESSTDHLHCGLGICSDNVPLMDSEQNCHPCNEPTSIYVGTDENKCKVCVNRRYEDGYCLLN